VKVLLTSTDNPYITQIGGKHIHLLLLERGLKTLDVEVTTLYYNPKKTQEILKRKILKLFPEKYRYTFGPKLIIDSIKKSIPRKPFNIIHAHDVLSLLATDLMPQKKVLTIHGYFARENMEFVKNEKNRKALYHLLFLIEKKAIKNANYIITVDQRLKDYIISEFNYPANKIQVIHNAIDTNRFSPISKKEQSNLKKKLRLGVDDTVILVPRRLVEKNGVIYAVRAIKHIKNRNIRMLIVGDGPQRKKIVAEAQTDNRIHFIGTVPHNKVDVYYKMADIILIPSITSYGIQEATSLAMLEGMACCKVVICSNIGGIKEIIRNMKNGILVEEKNPVHIATAVKTIIENRSLTVEIGNKAREYVLQNHSFLAHASKVAEIYQKTLSENCLQFQQL
jgi:glycosyltransferase involved in cell wall biosynthesis